MDYKKNNETFKTGSIFEIFDSDDAATKGLFLNINEFLNNTYEYFHNHNNDLLKNEIRNFRKKILSEKYQIPENYEKGKISIFIFTLLFSDEGLPFRFEILDFFQAWTFFQSKENDCFSSPQMINYLLGLIINPSRNDDFVDYPLYPLSAIYILYNILYDSFEARNLFIELNPVEQLSTVYYHLGKDRYYNFDFNQYYVKDYLLAITKIFYIIQEDYDIDSQLPYNFSLIPFFEVMKYRCENQFCTMSQGEIQFIERFLLTKPENLISFIEFWNSQGNRGPSNYFLQLDHSDENKIFAESLLMLLKDIAIIWDNIEKYILPHQDIIKQKLLYQISYDPLIGYFHSISGDICSYIEFHKIFCKFLCVNFAQNHDSIIAFFYNNKGIELLERYINNGPYSIRLLILTACSNILAIKSDYYPVIIIKKLNCVFDLFINFLDDGENFDATIRILDIIYNILTNANTFQSITTLIYDSFQDAGVFDIIESYQYSTNTAEEILNKARLISELREEIARKKDEMRLSEKTKKELYDFIQFPDEFCDYDEYEEDSQIMCYTKGYGLTQYDCMW